MAAMAVCRLHNCFATPASGTGCHQLTPVREAGHCRSQDMQEQNGVHPCGGLCKGHGAVFQGDQMPASPAPATENHQLAPFRELLHSLCGKVRQGVSPDQELPSQTMENVDRMSGTELRDHLLAIDPLDHLWVARVNQVIVYNSLCPCTDAHTIITDNLPGQLCCHLFGSVSVTAIIATSLGYHCRCTMHMTQQVMYAAHTCSSACLFTRCTTEWKSEVHLMFCAPGCTPQVTQ